MSAEPIRVLVVDDNEPFLKVMAKHLERQGYAVSTALDGFQALEVLQKNGPFAVLVTDLMMPGMNGVELLRAARQHDVWLEPIVITAAATLETAIAAMRADGAFDYLLKPLEQLSELSLAVERANTHRQLRLDRERLQAAMAAHGARLQALIANTSDAIVAANAHDTLTVINPSAAQLFGPALTLGANPQALPTPLANLLTNWHTVGQRRPTVVEVAWPPNAIHMVNLNAIQPTPQDYDGWVMVLRNVTHLRQVDEVRLNLLTNAANKLRMPLSQAGLTLTELSDALGRRDDRIASLLYRLVMLWDRLRDSVERLLTLAQVNSTTHIKLARVDLAPLWREWVEDMAQNAGGAPTPTLQADIPASLPLVQADPEWMRHLTTGLIGRALRRSPKRGVVRINAYSTGGQCWLEVSDDGPAVSEHDLPRLFEVGQSEASDGLGGPSLELALAKAITERLGGQVWVRGETRPGAVIAVCLPEVTAP